MIKIYDDQQDGQHVTVTFIIDRDDKYWRSKNNDEYIYLYLRCQEDWFNSIKQESGGSISVYDICNNLALNPKAIYAHIGFKKNSKVIISRYVHPKNILVTMDCDFI